ncbi:MAG: uroporphyrinogen decarboxylase family protein [Oscillospiraceae bacterium]|nr:uroporphyrinogen decarboxylase family protein [Oscillospiraceae bacterium]
MTSKERVFARLEGNKVDKIPNLNILMGLVAKAAGVNYREYASDHRKLVEGNIICAETYGLDSVSVISDPMREASAFGAEVEMPENGVPYSPVPLLSDPIDLTRLSLVDPYDNLRTLDRINGVRLLHERVGDDYPVIGWVEGVLAETADLRGVNELMMDLALNASYLDELMETVFSFQCSFAKAQVDEGADIIGIGNAVASLIGPDLYTKYAMDYDKRLVSYIKSLNAKTKLHICGNTTALRQIIRDEVKPDIFDIDWMVDYASTVEMFSGSGVSINGNIDPVGIFLQGSLQELTEATQQCIETADSYSFISAGCEIPADTPSEKLISMNNMLYQN